MTRTLARDLGGDAGRLEALAQRLVRAAAAAAGDGTFDGEDEGKQLAYAKPMLREARKMLLDGFLISDLRSTVADDDDREEAYGDDHGG